MTARTPTLSRYTQISTLPTLSGVYDIDVGIMPTPILGVQVPRLRGLCFSFGAAPTQHKEVL